MIQTCLRALAFVSSRYDFLFIAQIVGEVALGLSLMCIPHKKLVIVYFLASPHNAYLGVIFDHPILLCVRFF